MNESPLQIAVVFNDGRLVAISVVGEVDIRNSFQLRQVLNQYLEEEVIDIVVDLSGVPNMDTAGWKELTKAARMIHQRNGQVTLVGMCNRILGIYRRFHFESAFPSEESLAAMGIEVEGK